MKKEKYLKFKRSFFNTIIYCILINGPHIFSSTLADHNKSQIKIENLEDLFFRNDTKFENTDSFSNQFNSFFGIDYSLENKHFSDLAMPFTSRDIRKFYEDKLLQMYGKEINKFNDGFFNDKL